MPRPKAPGAPEPKKRSRTGCWNCKAKKVKCDERRPKCLNCERNGDQVCDYSIRLNWEGRAKRKGTLTPEPTTPDALPGRGLQTLNFNAPDSFSRKSPSTSLASLGRIDPALSSAGSPSNVKEASQGSTQFSKFKGYVPPKSTPRSEPRPSTSGSQKRKSQQDDKVSLDQRVKSAPISPEAASEDATSISASKRARLGPVARPAGSSTARTPSFANTGSPNSDVLPFSPFTPFESAADTLSVPSPASFPSDESATSPPRSTNYSYDNRWRMPSIASITHSPSEEPRRLSVNSLLIQEEAQASERRRGALRGSNDQNVFYGIDRGLPDRDIPENDDAHILDVVTPVLRSAEFAGAEDEVSTEFGLSSSKVACYDVELQVRIPRSLLPLPSLLHANPMNLMYFHFFIEFTARILVPHDCPANPFKVILPQMAVRDESLLHLLLAYAASHRARLLSHSQPSNRIAVWVRDVFPRLRHALDDPTHEISSSNVATAIMLASLEIIAPGTFGVEIPWQDHLHMARTMITSRAGSKGMNNRRDKVSHFLIRWFAYLDVLGNFSGVGVGKHNVIFSDDLYDFGQANEFSVDCLLGFSGFLAGLLAKIADLARHCDQGRLTDKGEINEAWKPTAQVVEAAEKIKEDLARARIQKYTLCPHRQSSTEQEMAWESVEMAALNEAFHWAGVVHLNRRVLGLRQDSHEVQAAVREIVGTIFKVRNGGSAEACLIFPLFTAGCEAKEKSQREIILARIKSVEESGMTQVQKARRVLERVWATGQPWETLVHGEFFG